MTRGVCGLLTFCEASKSEEREAAGGRRRTRWNPAAKNEPVTYHSSTPVAGHGDRLARTTQYEYRDVRGCRQVNAGLDPRGLSRSGPRGHDMKTGVAAGRDRLRSQAGQHATRGRGEPAGLLERAHRAPRAFPRGGETASTGAIAVQMQAERWSPSPKSRLQTNKRQEQRRSVLASHRRPSGHLGTAARRSGLTHSAAPKPVESVSHRLSDAGSIPAASNTHPRSRKESAA